jgi:S-adenosylmethionine:tRNA ribosyltransferase-isomerase
LYGNKEKTGARIEVFLLRELNEDLRLWDVLVDPARKIRIGNKLYFGEDDSMVAEVIDNTTSRGRTLRFLYDGPHDEFKEALYKLGEAPLPNFINRPVEEDDAERFQTIFAKNEGAVTAPTAGLHFSRELMKRMEIRGIDFAFITMHAGLGNFRDIDVEDLTKHKMDSEQMFVEADACRTVNKAVDAGKRICAVGTTVMRTIETAVGTDGHLKEFEGWTNKFIFPPYEFSVATSMVTNFHLPYSTLLMLVAAYGGYDLIMRAYDEALKEGYRFGTYGDAMLILDK